jgi:hypothetical protein
MFVSELMENVNGANSDDNMFGDTEISDYSELSSE